MVLMHGVMLSNDSQTGGILKLETAVGQVEISGIGLQRAFSIPLAENPHHHQCGLRLFGIVCRETSLGLFSSSPV